MSNLCKVTIKSIKDDRFPGCENIDHTRKDPPEEPRTFTAPELSDLLDLYEEEGAKRVRYNLVKTKTNIFPVERLRGRQSLQSMNMLSDMYRTMSIFGKCAAECLQNGQCRYEFVNYVGLQKGDRITLEKIQDFELQNELIEGLGKYRMIVQKKQLDQDMRDENQGRGYISLFDDAGMSVVCIGNKNGKIDDAKIDGERSWFPFQHGGKFTCAFDEVVFDGVILDTSGT